MVIDFQSGNTTKLTLVYTYYTLAEVNKRLVDYFVLRLFNLSKNTISLLFVVIVIFFLFCIYCVYNKKTIDILKDLLKCLRKLHSSPKHLKICLRN